MGLDQYAFAIPVADNMPLVDHKLSSDDHDKRQVFQWRKHANLQGWMERLYRARGGSSKDFNCATLRLTSEDLLALRRDTLAGKMPHTTGFFFGQSEPEDDADTLKFVEIALAHIDQGYAIYYDSWW